MPPGERAHGSLSRGARPPGCAAGEHPAGFGPGVLLRGADLVTSASGATIDVTVPQLRHLRAGDIPIHAPNAALMIDFDNVTLGIRSDLTKELKHLLNSDIIKGKVAVSRAYADWRRYHQYIVPLSESSIDLIFAPAFGTNKKNATDIRLAIDAMELVFTRPEIGTFILLSGDSDFSMLVIKLKEYGKYVIGVGIRESASDLLIQNCDEYYSYSDLAGLTKEADAPSTQQDPWQLVQDAVATMAKNRDVMRSDRLKQVMQQQDPNFDEKNAGFSRFSKFVLEASHRRLIKLTKLDNGQYEVSPAGTTPPLAVPNAALPSAPAAASATTDLESRELRPEGGRSRRGRGRGRGRGPREGAEGRAAAPAVEAAAVVEPRARPESRRVEGLTLIRAFELVRRALGELPSPVGNDALRLRMVALNGRLDPLLEPERFPRLLRQVHDAEVADVRKLGEDEFEIAGRGMEPAVSAAIASGRAVEQGSPAGTAPSAPTGEAAAVRGGIRFRRGSKLPTGRPDIAMVGVVNLDEEPAAELKPVKAAKAPRKKTTKPATEVDEAAPPRKKSSGGRTKKKAE